VQSPAKNSHPRGNGGNTRGPLTAFRHAVRPLRQIFTGLSHCWRVALLLAVGVSFEGCGGGGAVTGPPPPPPPPSIIVKVTPQSSSVLLGNTQLFSADITNASNTAVTWSVNGVVGGNGAVGTISAAGLYTAPADLPSNRRNANADSELESKLNFELESLWNGLRRKFVRNAGHDDHTIRREQRGSFVGDLRGANDGP